MRIGSECNRDEASPIIGVFMPGILVSAPSPLSRCYAQCGAFKSSSADVDLYTHADLHWVAISRGVSQRCPSANQNVQRVPRVPRDISRGAERSLHPVGRTLIRHPVWYLAIPLAVDGDVAFYRFVSLSPPAHQLCDISATR